MEFYRTIITCLPCLALESEVNNFANTCEDDRIAQEVMHVLERAEKPGESVHAQVSNIVHTTNWTESLAKCLLDKLVSAIKEGRIITGALKEAMSKAAEAATEFAKEHPVYATLIALGILVVLLPWVIEALGFTEIGPAAGEMCQSTSNTFPS